MHACCILFNHFRKKEKYLQIEIILYKEIIFYSKFIAYFVLADMPVICI